MEKISHIMVGDTCLYKNKLSNNTMIIGKILKNEKKIRFNVDIRCTNCQKKVPGGMLTGEQYYKSKEFENELKNFMKTYLCGICRDKKRITINQSKVVDISNKKSNDKESAKKNSH